MFIVWGQKRKEKRLGYATDFCTMCRDLQAFRILRIGSASHVYFMSMGGGALLGHLAICQSCGLKVEVDPTRYQSLAKRLPPDRQQLEQDTYPEARQFYAERIALEQELAAGRANLSTAQRKELIREPFTQMAPMVEERYAGSSHFDWRAGLTLFISILLPSILGVISANSQDSSLKSSLGYTALVIFCLGLLVTLVLLFTEARRFVRRKILPILAGSLHALQPSREELEECIGQLRSLGFKLAKKLQVDDVLMALEAPTQRLGEN